MRAKKPWAVAAAGVLLVGLGAAALGNYLDERPYTARGGIDDRDGPSKTAAEAVKAGRKGYTDLRRQEGRQGRGGRRHRHRRGAVGAAQLDAPDALHQRRRAPARRQQPVGLREEEVLHRHAGRGAAPACWS